jgi:hypothetical protein
MERAILRAGTFGQHLGLSAQASQSLLARKKDHRAVFRQPVAWLGESAVIFP